jgi:hypothetical protein
MKLQCVNASAIKSHSGILHNERGLVDYSIIFNRMNLRYNDYVI